MFGNCNHCCFCCGHPCTMLGVSLFISCKNKIQCVCVGKKKKIKTTLRYHLTPVRMGIIRQYTNNKCWRGCEEKGTLLHCWWECKLIQPLWRTVCSFLKKPKIELPYDPAIPVLGIYPEKTIIQRGKCGLPWWRSG